MTDHKSDITTFQQVFNLIEEARNKAYQKVNEELIKLYYRVGEIVTDKVEQGQWGDKTVQNLADYIARERPGLKGFTRRGLYRMKQFYQIYNPESECYILWLNLYEKNESPAMTQSPEAYNTHDEFMSTVLAQLQWSAHLLIISKTNNSEEQLFYLLHAIKEKLSVRELERQLDSGIFERSKIGEKIVTTALTQLPGAMFKDPYIFEFLDLPDDHSEKDLEKAIIENFKKFILEIGKEFTYMGTQYPIQVGNKDYYADLLFYHRELQCMVLFELKIEEFAPEFLGKLNFYLEALDRDVKKSHENPGIGVLLCKGKDDEVVEYAQARNISPAWIAEY